MNIYVGSLSFKMREDELQKAFEEFGEVTAARIITDKYSGRSKGFGFVEMANDDEAKRAIEELNGREIGGRKIIVNESVERERTERPERSERRPSFRDRNNDRRGGRDRY
jgi:RNA recognition motif-containing protein